MPQLCLYLQLHQPFRLRPFEVFDIGVGPVAQRRYFADREPNGNRAIFEKVSHKSYIPMLQLLEGLLAKYPDFQLALSTSGVFLEQAGVYAPAVISLLQQLAATGRVEFLAETYYHSLSSLFAPTEFAAQVRQHTRLVRQLFGQRPRIFRNTELIYSDEIGAQVAKLGFKGILTEAVPRFLADHHSAKTRVHANQNGQLPILLKHAELSDDIAFRFSDRHWQWYPLSLDRYWEWVAVYPPAALINLFMDFETFGEHQWSETGIFDFFAQLVAQTCEDPQSSWVTPAQVCFGISTEQLRELPRYHVPTPISWADVDRDITAWVENEFQQDCLRALYAVQSRVLASKNRALIQDWRRLQTSDHFYYMCTKWAADGDVHAYFSPYDSPFEAYRRFSTVLADLRGRL